MSWQTYRVTITRFVEEECCVWVTAEDEAKAAAKALSDIGEIANTVWRRSDSEASTYHVEHIESLK